MGSFRSEPELTKHTIYQFSRDHSYAVCHMCGWRRFMEDVCISISPFTYKNYSLFCVLDGHGGSQVALFTERHFPRCLENNESFKNGNFENALKETFFQVDCLLMTEQGRSEIEFLRKEQIAKNNSSEDANISRIGCTILALLVTKDWIYVANAGDCRAIAYTAEGICLPLSRDHKPNDPKQEERIKKAGGYIDNGRVNGCLNLSRALGDLQFKKNQGLKMEEQIITSDPQIRKVSRKGINFIIMGCDGIWQSKGQEQLVLQIKEKVRGRMGLGKILEQTLDGLVAKSKTQKQGTDNMSSILIKFDP